MTRIALILACATAAVAAGPVPAPSEKELIARHWGKVEGEGKFELKGGRLTLGLAGGDGSSELRVARTVRGDFTAQVRVEADCPDPTKGDAREPRCHAGLRVSGGGFHLGHYLFQQYHVDDSHVLQETPQRCVWTDRMHPQGGGGTNLSHGKYQNGLDAGQAVHLRVARKGKEVSVAYSLDDKDWDGPFTFPEELDFPDEVTVELFVSQTTRQKLCATFEKFVIEKPKAK